MVYSGEKQLFNQKNTNKDEEIDLLFLFKVFSRNWKIIGFFSIIFFIGSIFYTNTRKKIWEGNFEIVLSNASNKAQVSSISNDLTSFLGFGLNSQGASTLNTEVQILNSPLVLKPIFEYVKSEKKKKNPEIELAFPGWNKSSLEVNLKKGTSILEIVYRDNDKDIILPVLSKISSTYQDYSGKSKRRNIQLTKKYLTNQIDKFKIKSSSSIKKAQKFAMEQDLIINNLNLNTNQNSLNKSNSRKNDQNSSFIVSNAEIEAVRINAANEIRNIDYQIKKIKDLKDDYKQLQYIGSTIEGLSKDGLPKLLEDMETEIATLRTKYTDKDESIVRLLEKRDLFIKLLKERSIGYLKAERLVAEATMESAQRPKGVILKYKELIREASRDEETLVGLENQLNFINLEEARIEDPWELISNPYLSKKPVSPKKSKLYILGLFTGFLISYLLVLLKEKISGKVFEEKELERIIESKICERYTYEYETNKIKSESEFLTELANRKVINNLNFLLFSNLQDTQIEIFNSIIGNIKNTDIKINLENDISNFKESEEIILVTSMRELTEKALKKLKNKLQLFNIYVKGIILVN